MIIDLHSSQNWRVVCDTLKDLKHLVHAAKAGSNVLVPGPRFVHHSELLFAHARFDHHPVAEMVAGHVVEAVRAQLRKCGDGGKTTAVLTVVLIEAFAPLFVSDRLDADKRNRWKSMVSEIEELLFGGSWYGWSNSEDRREFISMELEDVGKDLQDLVFSYFDQAGDAAQLMVVDGLRQEPSLRTTIGYRYQTRIPAYSLKVPAFTHIESPMVLCLDVQVGSLKDIQKIFQASMDRNQPCVVFCRGAVGQNIVPTLLGNHREAGRQWMVYQVDNEQLEDFAVIAGTKVWPWVQEFAAADFGYADLVEWEGDCVEIRRAGMEEDQKFIDHVEMLSSRSGQGMGHEVELNDHRLAMLTNDYWELEIGQKYLASERHWLKERLSSVIQAAAGFNYGWGWDYATDIRLAVAKVMPKWFDEGVTERVCKALVTENKKPFPARVSVEIWTRAAAMAWLFLSSRVAIV